MYVNIWWYMGYVTVFWDMWYMGYVMVITFMLWYIYIVIMLCHDIYILWLYLRYDVYCDYVCVMIYLCDDNFMFLVGLGGWWYNKVIWWVWLSGVEFVLSVCGFMGWMMCCSGGAYPQFGLKWCWVGLSRVIRVLKVARLEDEIFSTTTPPPGRRDRRSRNADMSWWNIRPVKYVQCWTIQQCVVCSVSTAGPASLRLYNGRRRSLCALAYHTYRVS